MSEKNSSAAPGCLLRLAGIAVLLGALGFLGSLGLAWYHYTSTADFETYLITLPVDVGVLDERVTTGDVLHEGRSWQLGEVDPFEVSNGDPNREQAVLTVDMDMDHATDRLLSLRLKFLMVLDREDGTHLGFRIDTPQLRTHPNMRALVLVYLEDEEGLVGEGSEGRGSAIVDVFLAGGAGESKMLILRKPEDMPTRENVLTRLGLPSHSQPEGAAALYLSLLAHNVGAPPMIGLVHHMRLPLELGWRKAGGTTQGVGLYPASHATTTQEYSYDLTISAKSEQAGASHSQSSSFSRRYTWNEEVW